MFKHCLNNGFDDFTRRFSVDSPRKSGSWMMTSHICVWTFLAPPNPYHQLPDEMPSEKGKKPIFKAMRLGTPGFQQIHGSSCEIVKFHRPIFGGKVSALMSPHLIEVSKHRSSSWFDGLIFYLAMDQYLLIPFLVGWTSIYQLFWCSPGVQGFDTSPFSFLIKAVAGESLIIIDNHNHSLARWRPVHHQNMGMSWYV